MATAGVVVLVRMMFLFELVVEYRSLFAGFIGVREESIDPGTDDNGEIFGEEGGFEPLGRSSLSRAFFLGRALDYGAPGGARDSLAGFEKVVGKRRFDPPSVVSSWLVVSESEVGHRTFFSLRFF